MYFLLNNVNYKWKLWIILVGDGGYGGHPGGGGGGDGPGRGGPGDEEPAETSIPRNIGLYQSKLERDFDVNKELLEIAESG